MDVEVTEVVVADRHEALRKLVALRKAKKLRQVDVAARMGIGQPSVSELERGEVPPKVETLERYAAAISGTLKFVVLDIVEKEEGDADGSGSTEAGA